MKIKTIEMNISGMTCTGCELNVAQLLTARGVQDQEVNYQNKRASVTYDEDVISSEDLADLVAASGQYTVTDFEDEDSPGSDCCVILESVNTAKPKASVPCPSCKLSARSVGRMTVFHFLKPEYHGTISEAPYYYCSDPDCQIVYFTETSHPQHTTDQLREDFKQAARKQQHLLCYCFGYSAKMILKEIAETGQSDVGRKIANNIKENLCACEARNPSGKCCLGSVNQFVKQAQVSPS